MAEAPRGRPWTQGDYKRLERMAAEGKSVAEVASALKRSHPAIHQKACQMGIGFVHPTVGRRVMGRPAGSRKARKPKDEALATVRPKNIKDPEPRTIGRVDWAL